MSLYAEIVPPLTKMLVNVDSWIEIAIEHAKNKKFDPAVYLTTRLAPDQLPFPRQIQILADAAKFAAARASGKTPPAHADTEQTIDELRARLATVREYLATFTPADFEGAETRVIPVSFAPGNAMLAPNWVREFSLPNFYFHATTAYQFLRHNGVDLGKKNYIGRLTLQPA